MNKLLLNSLLSIAIVSLQMPALAQGPEHASLERGKALYRTGQMDAAVVQLDKAIGLNGQSAEGYYFRALVFTTLNQPDRALEDFNRAISIDPGVANFYLNRGLLYMNRTKLDQAIEDFTEAIRLDSHLQAAYVNRDYCVKEIEHQKRLAIEKVEKAAAEKLASEKAAQEKLAAEKAAAELALLPKGKSKSASADSKVSKHELERLSRDKVLAEKKKMQEEMQDRLDQEKERERQEKEKLLQQIAMLKEAKTQKGKTAASADAVDSEHATDRPVRDKWALIVGISKFQNPSLNLKYPSKDAQDFHQFLLKEANFQPDHVKLLTDEQATRANILSALGDKWLPHLATPDDLVLIYISSHGSASDMDVGGVNYLLAHDTDPENLYVSGLPMQDLTRIIKARVHSDRVVIVLDACHSGAANPESKGLTRHANVNVDEVVAGTGQLVISSSLPNQVSWESKQRQNSVFTAFLMEALKKNGKDTTLGEAFRFMKDRVQEEVLRERGVLQTPILKSKWEGKDLRLAAPASDPRPGLDFSSSSKPPAASTTAGAAPTGAPGAVAIPESGPSPGATPTAGPGK